MKRFRITHSKKSATKSVKEKNSVLLLKMTLLHKIKSKLKLFHVLLGKILIEVFIY